ncbi:MAG TPA: hypothetical protein VN733_06750 [Solirubrobacterales bacterium]|nr:hypothetical protein [Solirubrobacterales bacterium]
MRRLRGSLTYANVTATLALFVALSGAGAYAAQQLLPRSVGAKQLRPGAVTADKLRKNAVTAPKLKALAVKEGKLAAGAVTASKLGAAAVTGGSLAPAAVTTEKLADDAVTGEKVVEATLGKVGSAAEADFAAFAESANPPAFAAVDLEGNVNSSLSKGLGPADVVRKSAGVYCISVTGFIPRGAQVTPRNTGDGDVTAYVTIGGTEPCPAPKVEVRTYKGILASEPFYVSLYR